MNRLDPRLLLGAFLVLTVGGGILGVLPTIVVAAALYAIPGYLALSALFGVSLPSRVERWTLAIVMSIALIALGAQLLNMTPVGIQPVGWLIFFGLLAAVAMVAMLRGGVRRPWAGMPLVVSRREAQLLVTAAAVTMLAVVVAAQSATLQVGDGFTEMWIARETEDAVRVTVRNQEGEPTTYRIEVDAGGTVLSSEIALEPADAWSVLIDVPRDATSVKALLFRDDAGAPYRQVRLSTSGN